MLGTRNDQKVIEPVLWGGLAISFLLGYYMAKNEYWKLFFVGLAILTGAACMVTFVYYLANNYVNFIGNFSVRRLSGQIRLAEAIKGLTYNQLNLVEHYGSLNVETLLGPPPVFVATLMGGKVPMRFILDFMRASRDTEPYLWPVRERHHPYLERYSQSREMAAIVTAEIIRQDWAVEAAGPNAAKLLEGVTTDLIIDRWELWRFEDA